MKSKIVKKALTLFFTSVYLLIAFFDGLFISMGSEFLSTILGFIVLFSLLVLTFYILRYESKRTISSLNKELYLIWIYLSLNFAFSFVIGYTIPFLESSSRYNFGFFMIPLLLLLNYIILRRFYFFKREEMTQSQDESKKTNSSENKESKEEIAIKSELIFNRLEKPIIEFEEKKYAFSINSILILAIGAPILAYLVYFFFDNPSNYWLHEIVVKQTSYFLNLFFGMDSSVLYNPTGIQGNFKIHWAFVIPGRLDIYFETFCTGIQAICVFAGIIICTPHSQFKDSNKDIIWRKTKALIVSSVIFYVVNIVRMLIQLELYYIGYDWEDIHVSISAASSFIAAIIILLLHKWIPEFIISIIYTGTVISKALKKEEDKTETLNNQEKEEIVK